MSKPILKTAEEWKTYESQTARDPENLALCVAHKDAETADRAEYGYRLLALRAAARLAPQMEPRQLCDRQALRWNFYQTWLEIHRAKLQKLKTNPNYKSRRKRATDRARLVYIRDCQRTGTPINWPRLCGPYPFDFPRKISE